MIEKWQDKEPIIGENVYIHDRAVVMGDVTMKSGSSVWPNAVLRGDISSIIIGENTNIQDNATVHVIHNVLTIIGDRVTIGHNAIIHGCTIEDEVMIGMGAIVLDGAYIESGCIIGAGAVVPPNKRIPAGSVVMGTPGQVVRNVRETESVNIKNNAEEYCFLARLALKNV